MYIKSNNKFRIDKTELKSLGADDTRWRVVPFYVLLSIVVIFLFSNLFNLQLVDGKKYLQIASRTNQSEHIITPPRGLIYDRNGKKLAYNIPSYTLYFNPQEITKEAENDTVTVVADAFGLNKDTLQKSYKKEVYKKNKKTSLSRLTVKTSITFDEYIDKLPIINSLEGVYIEVEAVRHYVDSKYFAHIIGYVGDPSEKDVENGIYIKSQVGKVGIEYQYDKELRGREGVELVQRQVVGNQETVIVPQEKEPGDNLYLTIDKKWQKMLSDLMEEEAKTANAFASAGVIMNSSTGEILASVSLPGYDNNLFTQGISSSDFSLLLQDPKTPLLNRVIGLQLPPGSVFKIIGATSGLDKSVINESTYFLSDRCMTLPGDIKFCEADGSYLGNVNVISALAASSNIFFCNVALKLPGGIRDLESYAEDFGIGQLTQVDLIGEQKGTMASPELKQRLWNEPWYLGDQCNAIIGQGLITVTPIQMTVVASAVQNGGKVLAPRFFYKQQEADGKISKTHTPVILRNLKASAETLAVVRKGMREVVVNGTASQLKGLPGNIIAKTGSSDAAEIINGVYYSGAHSWVVGCFDYDDQNYCFTVMQQWGGRGYKTVPIMKKFINCLYNDFADSCKSI